MSVQQNTVKNTCDIEPGDWGLVPYARDDSQNVRLGSSSSQTSQSNSGGDICRICHCEADALNPLLAPCYCSGSLKYVHQACLQQWLTASETRSCELCKFPFIMHTKIKPFNEWRRLKMSGHERRRLCCAVLFHCVAALCVVWSLFVLIDRAAEEVQRGLIAWPFWTKLVVVAVGFTGGAVFMYIQCRQYLHLCNRWRAHNRILLIQNAPEKMSVIPPSPPVIPYISTQSSATRSTLDQVVANIENNPHYEQRIDWNYDENYEVTDVRPVERDIMRDLVYVSQDAYQQSKPATTSTAPPNSSVFLENKDILGENKGTNTPSKIAHRHSTALMINTNLEQKQPDFRRYSDTKLLQNFNVANNLTITNVLGDEVSFTMNDNVGDIPKTNSNSNHDLEQAQSSTSKTDLFNNAIKSVFHISNEKPCISDIIFENSSNFDPLELNIQEMLELDFQTSHKKSVLSLNHRDSGNGFERNKSFFKSLPNLSASSENLLP